MGRDVHLKAQDVFNRSSFVFGQKSTFEQAFPQINDITVRVREIGYGMPPGYETRLYSKQDLCEYVNCRNYSCYNGGVRVGDMIRDMIRERKTHLEGSKYCQGYEGSPKGRRRYRSCTNSFEVVIDIEYKEKTAP